MIEGHFKGDDGLKQQKQNDVDDDDDALVLLYRLLFFPFPLETDGLEEKVAAFFSVL